MQNIKASWKITKYFGDKSIVAYLLFFVLFLWPVPTMAVYQIPRKVLVLHSYHSGLSWTDSLVEGINKGLADSGIIHDITHEFMDTKRIFTDRYLDELAALYTLKFNGSKFDVILVTDDLAFTFIRKHYDRLFPGVPVVFCGINFFKETMLQGFSKFTGVLEAFDIPATLNIAIALQPKAKRFVVLSDMTPTGRTNKKVFLEAMEKVSKPMDVIFLENLTMDEVRKEMSRLGERDIAIWLSYTSDSAGNYFSFGRSAHLISETSKAPLYSLWDFHLGYGIVGGKLISGFYQGNIAAKLAARILAGEPAASIPVVTESPNRYMFDFAQLQRFNIDTDSLPVDSIVINRPQTFYSQYKTAVWGIVVGFICLAAIILLLLLNVAGRRRANIEISKAKDRFQRIFNDTAVALLEIDFSRVYQRLATLQAQGVVDISAYYAERPEESQEIVRLTQVLDCNIAALSLYGVAAKKELLGVVDEELQRFILEYFSEILVAIKNDDMHLQWEVATKRLDGVKIDVLLGMKPDDRMGSVDTLIISAVDITERKRYFESLRRSENRFRTLFDSAASGIALIDGNGRYLRVNDALCSMLGFTREEMETSFWQEMTHPEDIKLTEMMISDLQQGKSVLPTEKRYIHKDGRIVWGLINVGLNIEESSAPQHYVVQVQDISQIKEVQAGMRLREERYRQIFEADLSGFFISNPSGKVLLCNQVFAGILGFTTVTEVVGQNVASFYSKTDGWSGVVEALWNDKKIENSEMELVRGDGEVVNVLFNGIGRCDEQGQLLEIQGHMMDISRQKHLEVKLVRAQKMEAIGLMVGGVAHDLNNILSGIINYPELMLVKLDTDNPLRKPLQSIKESGLRAAAVVADLLTVARGAANVREVHNIHEMAKEYLNSPECSRLRALYPNIAIRLRCLTENASILCSPVHIKKCLMNLVTNAVEAIENVGLVQLVIREEQQTAGKNGDGGIQQNVIIEVIDDGPGISEKDRERIFEPFYTKKVMGKSGTGLGLAVVWNTVQDHGGKIQVTGGSQGTTFSLFFPRMEKVTLAPVVEQEFSGFKGDGESILVVDDEAVPRDIACQILTVLGYTVYAVACGEEAITFLQGQKVDLVLLDMFMDPGMNGCLTYQKIIERHPGQKAIIASGFSKSDDVKKAMQLGVGGFIEKPYSMEQLARVVCRELHGSDLSL